jgi:hypothetical protein
MNNLKQIGLAMHSYADANGHLPPPAVYDKKGKALLSWRVLILPSLGEDALYNEFKLDEAWDSPHNKKLLAKMPSVYAVPGVGGPQKDRTYYQVFVGKGTMFEGQDGIRLSDVPDGPERTIMIIEGGKSVPWTKPEDLPYDTKKPLPKLGGLFENGIGAAYADGSAHFIPRKMGDEKTMRALITRNGAETLDPDKTP